MAPHYAATPWNDKGERLAALPFALTSGAA